MGVIFYDDDEWEPVIQHRPCTTCGGDLKKCNGACNGMSSCGQRRRPAHEVARIRAERQQREDDEILRRADLIRAARGMT
jgi:hypothetical protein